MSGLLRFWLFALSAFEAITLARYINGGANAAAFNEVMPLHREASPTAGHLWAFTIVMLAIIRTIQGLNMKNAGLWSLTATIHVVEAVFYTYMVFWFDHSLPTSLAGFDAAKHVPGMVVFGGIIANAFIFTAAALSASSAKAAAGGDKKSK